MVYSFKSVHSFLFAVAVSNIYGRLLGPGEGGTDELEEVKKGHDFGDI